MFRYDKHQNSIQVCSKITIFCPYFSWGRKAISSQPPKTNVFFYVSRFLANWKCPMSDIAEVEKFFYHQTVGNLPENTPEIVRFLRTHEICFWKLNLNVFEIAKSSKIATACVSEDNISWNCISHLNCEVFLHFCKKIAKCWNLEKLDIRKIIRPNFWPRFTIRSSLECSKVNFSTFRLLPMFQILPILNLYGTMRSFRPILWGLIYVKNETETSF